MPAKKTAQKKLKQPPLTVTIRQVEARGPCDSNAYGAALKLIHSHPVPDGPYDYNTRSKTRSRYGPDDPIPFAELAAVLDSYAMEWLVNCFLPRPILYRITDRQNEIEQSSFSQAAREILSNPKLGKRK